MYMIFDRFSMEDRDVNEGTAFGGSLRAPQRPKFSSITRSIIEKRKKRIKYPRLESCLVQGLFRQLARRDDGQIKIVDAGSRNATLGHFQLSLILCI